MAHPLADVLDSQDRSMSWLARKCDKSPSYVLRVTKGERRPSAEFRAKAAEALGVPESLLFPELEGDPTREAGWS